MSPPAAYIVSESTLRALLQTLGELGVEVEQSSPQFGADLFLHLDAWSVGYLISQETGPDEHRLTQSCCYTRESWILYDVVDVLVEDLGGRLLGSRRGDACDVIAEPEPGSFPPSVFADERFDYRGDRLHLLSQKMLRLVCLRAPGTDRILIGVQCSKRALSGVLQKLSGARLHRRPREA